MSAVLRATGDVCVMIYVHLCDPCAIYVWVYRPVQLPAWVQCSVTSAGPAMCVWSAGSVWHLCCPCECRGLCSFLLECNVTRCVMQYRWCVCDDLCPLVWPLCNIYVSVPLCALAYVSAMFRSAGPATYVCVISGICVALVLPLRHLCECSALCNERGVRSELASK